MRYYFKLAKVMNANVQPKGIIFANIGFVIVFFDFRWLRLLYIGGALLDLQFRGSHMYVRGCIDSRVDQFCM